MLDVRSNEEKIEKKTGEFREGKEGKKT